MLKNNDHGWFSTVMTVTVVIFKKVTGHDTVAPENNTSAVKQLNFSRLKRAKLSLLDIC